MGFVVVYVGWHLGKCSNLMLKIGLLTIEPPLIYKEDMSSIPDFVSRNLPAIPDIVVSVDGVEKLLCNLNPNIACGPDGIIPRILKECAHEIAPALTVIFQMSLDSGTLPLDWKRANISPIFKKGDRSKASNYRPVSLTCVACKLSEHIIHSHTMKNLDSHKILTTAQHGFRCGHSCETQLIQTVHDFAFSLDNKTETDVVIMDFSKAFDTFESLIHTNPAIT